MIPTHPFFLAGRAESPNHGLDVRDKFSGETIARVPLAGPEHLEEAIAAAADAAAPLRRWPAFRRRAVLDHLVRRVEERAEEFAVALCREAGKPIRFSRGEVTRLVDTLRVAAEESVRQIGEVMPLDISERAEGYRGMWKRVPVGPCGFITPFNFPLNLVAHKIGPALAVGCPFVLKPASDTPLGALLLGELLAETDLPPGACSILPCRGGDAAPLVEDGRIRYLSFTGSPAVGWDLKARAGKKRVCLELGGNAACVVDEGSPVDPVVDRLVTGAFYQSGQSCIGVQRVLIHASLYEVVRDRLVAAARALKLGDPREEETFLGPMISDGAAKRVEDWIREAREAGAKVLCGGGREGAMMPAAVLENVPHAARIWSDEVFGPAVCLEPFTDFDAALAVVNDSAYGIQAGVFTRDLHRALRAWDELEVGGVVINDIPSWRVDHMPYGGVKSSGLGREGLRFAMEEMTEIRLLVIREGQGDTIRSAAGRRPTISCPFVPFVVLSPHDHWTP